MYTFEPAAPMDLDQPSQFGRGSSPLEVPRRLRGLAIAASLSGDIPAR
jgi:hypothetical protein